MFLRVSIIRKRMGELSRTVSLCSLSFLLLLRWGAGDNGKDSKRSNETLPPLGKGSKQRRLLTQVTSPDGGGSSRMFVKSTAKKTTAINQHFKKIDGVCQELEIGRCLFFPGAFFSGGK